MQNCGPEEYQLVTAPCLALINRSKSSRANGYFGFYFYFYWPHTARAGVIR